MWLKYIILLFVLSISQVCISQGAHGSMQIPGSANMPGSSNIMDIRNPRAKGDIGASRANIDQAKFQINDIKIRGIIVRLHTNKDRITAYRKSGNKKVADKMEEKAKMQNYMLEMAYINKWTYCPMYFMEAQNTAKLLREDTLIAKTWDMLRDTSIYYNHDSFYIIDFGDLMENGPADDNVAFKKRSKTEQSTNPASGSCLVVKDAQQQQLQYPFPYFSKVILEELSANRTFTPILIPDTLAKDIEVAFSKYASTADVMRSDAKQTLSKYASLTYPQVQSGINTTAYERAVDRLNKHFIEYYCARLDKDKNILCNDDPYYWWQRNPNIRYVQSLPALELRLKNYAEEDPQFIKPH